MALASTSIERSHSSIRPHVSRLATACHLAWQIGTVDINDGTDCWNKFRSNQWLGAFLFAGIAIGNLLKSSS